MKIVRDGYINKGAWPVRHSWQAKQKPPHTSNTEASLPTFGENANASKQRFTTQLLFFNNGLRQFFAGKEAYTIFRWNLDDFPVAWIDPFACSALAHLEGAKAY